MAGTPTGQRDEPNVMSVYDPLREELQRTGPQTIRLTFSEIEAILGRPLPPSAYKFNAWWGNNLRKAGHTQSMAWLHAGFVARVSLRQRAVEFIDLDEFHRAGLAPRPYRQGPSETSPRGHLRNASRQSRGLSGPQR
ncbi:MULTISPECIES: DUF7662 domain-containing protein [Bradyrhizobium]|uniref:DUF7662 domain-containing protein n=2 Tax=Bradyrhizobium TaxID=374 RepID=UPI003B8A8474